VREDRRGFLAGLLAALFGIPGVAALLGARGTRGRWIDAGPLESLPDGEPTRFAYEVAAGWEKRKKACFLVRKGDSVLALDATCTHAGCMVRIAARDDAGGGAGALVCPCHGGAFSVDGEPVKRPVTRPLARLETRIEGGRVQVRA
jgi:nitrite reductase/ring-hydroxylating ferredoxin subunit